MQMAKTAATANYTFYTSAEYWPELISRIEQTRKGERVALMSMDFNPTEPTITLVMQALLQAAERGVNVWFSVDARPWLLDSSPRRPGPLWRGKKLVRMSPISRQRLQIVQAINAQPTGHAAIINK